ncbi:YbaK/EbsC family protein [Specibacter cremeus]|uniref:YbaK/EbsC family protein n=1 Tax=Specibacter cremeus TaxID=1629051 RepID=UPI00197BF847|nr:YbaK/EbsC family protein [Specibacter cremeus]
MTSQEAPQLHPAVADALTRHGLEHRVVACPADLADTAEFCEHFGIALEQAANTILVTSKKADPPSYALCVVLGTTRLDVNSAVRRRMGVKRASFADADTTTELTGMLIGGVTAVGIDSLPIYVDAAVLAQEEVVMGGGNRTSKIFLDPGELVKLPRVEIVEDLALPRAHAH